MKSAVKIRLLSLGLAATLAAASSSFAQPRDDAGSGRKLECVPILRAEGQRNPGLTRLYR